jgi:hypothetical protein
VNSFLVTASAEGKEEGDVKDFCASSVRVDRHHCVSFLLIRLSSVTNGPES